MMDRKAKERLSVLMTTPALDQPGGVAFYCETVTPHFSDHVETYVVGKRATDRGGCDSLVRTLHDLRHFDRKLREESYDLVHFNPSLRPKAVLRDGMLLLAAKRRKIPVVVTFHGWNLTFERSLRRWFLPLFRCVFFRADAIIVVGTEFKRKLEEMGRQGPVYAESSVVPDSIFEHGPSLESRAAADNAKRRFHILFLSRVEREKGVYETLDAYAMIRQALPHASLTVAGEGAELAAAQAYANRKGLTGVTFPGYIRGETKRQAFLDADVYVLPTSHGEGMPHSVLEAMAYGLPVITRPIGGTRDFFENERMGYLTESLEATVFSDYLMRMATHPEARREMGRYNQQFAREHFSASRIAANLEAIYRRTLATDPPC